MLCPEQQTLSVSISLLNVIYKSFLFLVLSVVTYTVNHQSYLFSSLVAYPSLSSFLTEKTVNKRGSENISPRPSLGGEDHSVDLTFLKPLTKAAVVEGGKTYDPVRCRNRE